MYQNQNLLPSSIALIMSRNHQLTLITGKAYSENQNPQGEHSIVKNTGGGAGSIVWGLGFCLGKDILGFFKNIDLNDS